MNEARPTASARAATSRRRCFHPGSRQGEKVTGRWGVACAKTGGGQLKVGGKLAGGTAGVKAA